MHYVISTNFNVFFSKKPTTTRWAPAPAIVLNGVTVTTNRKNGLFWMGQLLGDKNNSASRGGPFLTPMYSFPPPKKKITNRSIPKNDGQAGKCIKTTASKMIWRPFWGYHFVSFQVCNLKVIHVSISNTQCIGIYLYTYIYLHWSHKKIHHSKLSDSGFPWKNLQTGCNCLKPTNRLWKWW